MNIKNISSSGIVDKKYLNNKWCHVYCDRSSCGHDLVVFLKHYNAEQLITINMVAVIFSSFLSICLICSTIEEIRLLKRRKDRFPQEIETKKKKKRRQTRPKEREMKDTLVIGYSIDNKKKKRKIDRKRTSDDNSKKKAQEETTFLRAYSLPTKLVMQILRRQCLSTRVINCPWYCYTKKKSKWRFFLVLIAFIFLIIYYIQLSN
jgi:hypothetical protein